MYECRKWVTSCSSPGYPGPCVTPPFLIVLVLTLLDVGTEMASDPWCSGKQVSKASSGVSRHEAFPKVIFLKVPPGLTLGFLRCRNRGFANLFICQVSHCPCSDFVVCINKGDSFLRLLALPTCMMGLPKAFAILLGFLLFPL